MAGLALQPVTLETKGSGGCGSGWPILLGASGTRPQILVSNCGLGEGHVASGDQRGDRGPSHSLYVCLKFRKDTEE